MGKKRWLRLRLKLRRKNNYNIGRRGGSKQNACTPVIEALELASEKGLLYYVSNDPLTYAFSNHLIRTIIYDLMPTRYCITIIVLLYCIILVVFIYYCLCFPLYYYYMRLVKLYKCTCIT